VLGNLQVCQSLHTWPAQRRCVPTLLTSVRLSHEAVNGRLSFPPSKAGSKHPPELTTWWPFKGPTRLTNPSGCLRLPAPPLTDRLPVAGSVRSVMLSRRPFLANTNTHLSSCLHVPLTATPSLRSTRIYLLNRDLPYATMR
jgi:hypothetical protein